MKKLILLLILAFVMCGCMRQHIKDYGIVEKVELKEVTFTDGSPTTIHGYFK
jgi:PBP1b-binding outer membrane lipoprotein LpoB